MIDKEKVICHLNDCMEASRRDNTWVFVRKDIVDDVLAMLKEAVHCKDCKYWRQNTEFCGRWSVGNVAQHTPPDWFCADGERW